jgi:hypothetical protein
MLELQEPVQPANIGEWAFIDELVSEFRRKPNWSRSKPCEGELSFVNGVRIFKDFPDPEGLLKTAWFDLERFFKDISVPIIKDKYLLGKNSASQAKDVIDIKTVKEEQVGYESYCIEIIKNSITIKAGDTEGIRRGIFYLEDLMLSSDGPFLKPTTIKRRPWVKNRISRCTYGPIKRPPFNRDELMDDTDYYPDEYLNRLAHEGINVLWLTIEFRDLCKPELVPGYGKDREKRLNKLRFTVDKCRRYGIKVFLFCIEPRIWSHDDPLIVKYPEIVGAKRGKEACFCPFTEASQKYLYEIVKSIFLEVPKLGGISNCSHGERMTSCLSSVPATSEAEVICPRCSKKEKSEILEGTHAPIIKAMLEINPDAQFISSIYMPQAVKTAKWIFTIPEKLPKETVLVFNFESGGEKEQLGKIRIGADYWQSYDGPSHRFIGMAKAVKKANVNMGAKIQVGCSHEVATIPFVPAPPILWKKYRTMYDLNVMNVSQAWYFGNYPGIMNKAAGELSFESWDDSDYSKGRPQEEYDFLYRLAKIDWGNRAEQVVKAWYYFYKGYSNYPMDTSFQYYGPMHDGVVWPLHLFPLHKPLTPTWKLDFPTSGDSIGESLIQFTIREAIELCGNMVKYWKRGIDILRAISPDFVNSPERLKDIGIAEALYIQFESGLNILKFYDLREQLLYNDPFEQDNNGLSGSEQFSQTKCLDEMEVIVKGEIKRSIKMVELCKSDSRLGFHPEAEGYKYFPEKLLWRVKLLEKLLEDDFNKMRAILESENKNIDDIDSQIQNLKLTKHNKDFKIKDLVKLTTPLNAPVYNCTDSEPARGKTFEWSAIVKKNILNINLICNEINNGTIADMLYLHIKAGDLGYPYNFVINLKAARNNNGPYGTGITKTGYFNYYIAFPTNCYYEVKNQGSKQLVNFEIDLEKMPGFRGQAAIALSIVRDIKTSSGDIQDLWSGENPHGRYRLGLSNYNPETMGRLELI